jgi:hypothetical protein
VEPDALRWLHGDRNRAAEAHRGEIEELPSGSFRVRVYAGIDPVSKQKHYLVKTIPAGLRQRVTPSRCGPADDGDAQPAPGSVAGGRRAGTGHPQRVRPQA